MSYKHWLPLLLALNSTALYAASEELPADELLEFLGSYESADGQWIDPTDFEVPLSEPLRAERGGVKDE